ncbi:reverse transcriptase [Gossypium australe]|uniref:Reverse transcriptase n=1 Tax=Gossypium australe TaxID=47621 RepID=A0A5B6VDI5_9ROSI|nr:reverse transcriptase [Gossypium australe]
MSFEALVGNTKAIVLVDSGSTHNFLYTRVEQLKVVVADGRCLMTRGTLATLTRTHLLGFWAINYAVRFQKARIEKIIQEMLHTGVIKDNFSSFALHTIMLTIKDKFPIHIIEKLLDELSHARVFSKLDLKLGYHQIRMNDVDIYKTAFRTHEGHYEFLVMPFGLTNAPSSFQALINAIFKPFLRKIVVSTLGWLFQILRQHTLFVKQRKCLFGTEQVEYLGHVITLGTVAMDKGNVACCYQLAYTHMY